MKYSKDRLFWIREREGIGTIGLTKYSFDTLGKVMSAHFDDLEYYLTSSSTNSDHISLFQKIGEIQTTNTSLAIEMPVSGTVRRINHKIVGNEKPIDSETWLFKVKLDTPLEKFDLLNEI